MADIKTEKIELRKQIISAAKVYKNQLAGRVFLYVYGDNYFEVAYLTESFKHLTGVESSLKGKSFYDNAKNATLAASQIGFSARHPLKTAKKKIRCLHRLPELTNGLACVVKDMNTITITYKLGITNLSFTVGLTEHIDPSGKKRDNWFVPRTLRINDKALDNSKDAEFIDFIFSKKVTEQTYTELCYADPQLHIPENVRPLLDAALLNETPEPQPV